MERTKILKLAVIEKETMIDPLSVEVETMIDQVLVEKNNQLSSGLKLQIYIQENDENFEVIVYEVIK